MNRTGTAYQPGFSLVELMTVVIILSVLAGVAVHLYASTRRASAARACKANVAAIAAAETAYALINGQYAATPMAPFNASDPTAGGLIGAPQGLSAPVACPLDDRPYVVTGGGLGQPLEVSCPHSSPANGGDGLHEAAAPSKPAGSDNYSMTLAAPAAER